ncbi:MAG: ClbS/DfsB family four-helix bundle protein [Ktedonobacteraceae bacterium]|nr:ClbS/DfsB family four-helix bundle protein [Ktedonobacteraceae bacterium]
MERKGKAELLQEMRSSYNAFKALLASLSPEQMTTPGVNDTWSVKDNIAHLSAWHHVALNRIQAMNQGTPRFPLPGKTEDEVNEHFYQQNKARSLDDILAEFDTTYQQIENEVQSLSEEALHRPLAWRNDASILPTIAGNTYEHYAEHSQIIRDWLAQQEQHA